jgi:hypothetical protein
MNTPEATAFHEAGHIVIAHFVNLRVKSVTILPSDDYHGLATSSRQFDHDTELLDLFCEDQPPEYMCIDEFDENITRIIAQELKTALGGYVAEKLYGIENTSGAYSDFQSVIDRSFKYKGSGEEATEFVDQLLVEVELLLKEKWIYVQAIAAALLEQKELSQKDLMEVLSH